MEKQTIIRRRCSKSQLQKKIELLQFQVYRYSSTVFTVIIDYFSCPIFLSLESCIVIRCLWLHKHSRRDAYEDKNWKLGSRRFEPVKEMCGWLITFTFPGAVSCPFCGKGSGRGIVSTRTKSAIAAERRTWPISQ